MEAIFKKELIVNKTLCRLIGVSVFVILTTLGAFVRIPLPFTPVPITMQTFFVLLAGAFLGSSLGAISQLSYIFIGVSGASIFTHPGSGLPYLMGPTGGYILGFVFAALFVGRFIKYTRNNLFSILSILCLGDLIIFTCGLLWLRVLFGFGLAKLFFVGFIPFIPGDFLKVLAASLVYLRLKSRLKEIF